MIEMMVSVLLLLFVGGTVFSLLAYYQKTYGRTRMKADMYDGLRGVMELMSQEIGQAGMLSLPYPSLTQSITGSGSAQTVSLSSTACIIPPQTVIVDTGINQESVSITGITAGAITAIFVHAHSQGAPVLIPPCLTQAVTSTGSQSVTVSSTASMFVGEKLNIDVGSSQDPVTVTAINQASSTITAAFASTHTATGAVGAPIYAEGVFPSGVLTGTINGVSPTSDATHLMLFGDVNADGSLVFVQYDCNTSTNPGYLTRSVTTVTPTATAASAYQTLLTNVVANPGGTACFQYRTTTSGAYSMVPSIAVTLTVQTSAKDPQTGAYLTLTKGFLNLQPRNVLIAVELLNNGGMTNYIQVTPPNLPLSGG